MLPTLWPVFGRQFPGLLVITMLLASMLPVAGRAENANVLSVGAFSGAAAHGPFPAGWEPLLFKKIEQHTRYKLVADHGVVVVQADSTVSSSGMVRKLHVDPKQYPVLHWRWKVDNVLEKGNVHTKEGDDYPARLYITFAYDASKVGIFEQAKYAAAKLFYGEYPPLGAINYIWASRAAVGLQVANPYTDRVRMIVVQSGREHIREWQVEERNVYQDYLAAFGEEPPMISGIAIMTDTDNTGESARAYYGDIEFRSRAGDM